MLDHYQRAAVCCEYYPGLTNVTVGAHSDASVMPFESLRLNATWENIAQIPVDLSAFVTNVTKKYGILQINDNSLRGFISSTIGEPRMYGVRLCYRFGN